MADHTAIEGVFLSMDAATRRRLRVVGLEPMVPLGNHPGAVRVQPRTAGPPSGILLDRAAAAARPMASAPLRARLGGVPGLLRFPRIAVTVDAVVLAPTADGPGVLLIRRGHAPFEGAWALPGGFVEEDEDLEPAARRELLEETGVDLVGPLAQLGAFGAPGRDPRGRTVSVVHWTRLEALPPLRPGDDAAHAELVPLAAIERGEVRLAFDHREILDRALEAARAAAP